MEEFRNKVVIITGASSGIGASTAVEYAKRGARLALGGRNEENLNKTKTQCIEEGLKEDEILLVLGDLTEEAACNELVDKAFNKFGQIDILINNAGSCIKGNLEECSVSDLDHMYKTHARSTFMMSKRATPHLIKTKGSIVNVSSIAGAGQASQYKNFYCYDEKLLILPPQWPQYTVYGMAKAAVNHLTGTMAQDLAPKGVNVNAVAPGGVETGIFTRPESKRSPDQLQEYLKKYASIHPMQRIASPKEIADNIVHLTSEAASFITGTILTIDGGRSGNVQ